MRVAKYEVMLALYVLHMLIQGKMMTNSQLPFEPTVTVFMLVKTSPEWLGFPVDRRFKLLEEHFTPILKKHAANVSLRFFGVEFYSTRVTDI